MTPIDLVHIFNVSIDEYIKIIFEPAEEEINDLTELPNVKEREEIERYEDEKIVRTKVRYSAMGFIPPPIRKYLKPHMLSWIEHSTWYKAERCWDWYIEPHFFKEIITCKGKMSLHEDGTQKTKRITSGHLNIRIPVVGQMAENLIVTELKKNFDKEYRMFNQMLKRTGRIK